VHAPAELKAEIKTDLLASHYRPDIDGLRAIAVLSVVIFHAFPRAAQGGFVGVDVFFVISGFLITSIIVGNLDRGTFSFREFYARRIRRIFPALILVSSASLALGSFVLLADEYRQLGKHVAAGAGFVSNFIFWQEANYFDSAADTKILLHLWSLGVEEQYYAIWPALVWAAWKKHLNLLTLFFTIWAVSFFANVHTVGQNAAAAFYSPQSRFWELLTGGLLAYLTQFYPSIFAIRMVKIPSWIQKIVFRPGYESHSLGFYMGDAAALIGVTLLTYSMFSISQQEIFPGWWAMMPVAGTSLVIFAGQQAWTNRVILSSPILVWFGLISYPLYLWHWPLLAFARTVMENGPSPRVRIILLIISVASAWLTYRLVEIPIRFGARKTATVYALCVLMFCVGVFGYYIFRNKGLGFRFGERNQYAAYFEGYLWDGHQNIVDREQISQNRCNFYDWKSPWPKSGPRESIDAACYTKHSQKSVLILGDSNAADLYYGLNEVLPKDVSTLLIFSSGCQVRSINVGNVQGDHCEMANYFAMNQIKQSPPDVVLMSSNSSFDINYIRQFATTVKGYGVKHVLVLGQRPHWKPYLYKVVLRYYWDGTPRYIKGHQEDELLAFGDRFKAQLMPDEPFEFVDEKEPFCNADGCLTYLGDNRRDGLITFDDAHLRPFASVYLAQKQLAPLILKRLAE
jgi:peptidoglycan/LPS O-acetylase OafA/YrhL